MTVVIGTAGHIDHGKTSLLRALTGIDADRLPEERRRGMTIDVGYAHLDLPDGSELDFVDVPGHDRLIGNMLVGAGEIDAALLVVAADDGPRAQTIEHLELLDALGIRVAVAVVTKVDLVDPARAATVAIELDRILGRTTMAGAPVVAVSAVRGDGLDDLRAALVGLRDRVEDRRPAEPRRDGAMGSVLRSTGCSRSRAAGRWSPDRSGAAGSSVATGSGSSPAAAKPGPGRSRSMAGRSMERTAAVGSHSTWPACPATHPSAATSSRRIRPSGRPIGCWPSSRRRPSSGIGRRSPHGRQHRARCCACTSARPRSRRPSGAADATRPTCPTAAVSSGCVSPGPSPPRSPTRSCCACRRRQGPRPAARHRCRAADRASARRTSADALAELALAWLGHDPEAELGARIRLHGLLDRADGRPAPPGARVVASWFLADEIAGDLDAEGVAFVERHRAAEPDAPGAPLAEIRRALARSLRRRATASENRRPARSRAACSTPWSTPAGWSGRATS